MADKALQTLFAEAWKAEKDAIVPRVAEYSRPVYGNVPVSKDERRLRFWQTEEGWTPEREYRLLTGMNPDGTPVIDPQTGQPAVPLSPRAVGIIKFPYREIDAKAGGRADDLSAIAAYFREMAELGPPEPEHTELMAMQQGERDAGDTLAMGSAAGGSTSGPLDPTAPVGLPLPSVPPAVPVAPPAGVVPPPIPDPLMGG